VSRASAAQIADCFFEMDLALPPSDDNGMKDSFPPSVPGRGKAQRRAGRSEMYRPQYRAMRRLSIEKCCRPLSILAKVRQKYAVPSELPGNGCAKCTTI
jgi:hypothetical protein